LLRRLIFQTYSLQDKPKKARVWRAFFIGSQPKTLVATAVGILITVGILAVVLRWRIGVGRIAEGVAVSITRARCIRTRAIGIVVATLTGVVPIGFADIFVPVAVIVAIVVSSVAVGITNVVIIIARASRRAVGIATTGAVGVIGGNVAHIVLPVAVAGRAVGIRRTGRVTYAVGGTI